MTGQRLPIQGSLAGARFDPFTGKPLSVQDPGPAVAAGPGPSAQAPGQFHSPGTASDPRFRGKMDPLSAHVLAPNPLKRKAVRS